MLREEKYARIERERRFLVSRFPPGVHVVAVRRLFDRYIEGARLRLRRQTDSGGEVIFKLTQKIPLPDDGAQQGLITTMHLNEAEYQLLATLPARELSKTRYSMPPFGIDVFEGELAGLITAEAEFESVEEAAALVIPPFVAHEVTRDVRFTGGRLASASRDEVARWLNEYGIERNASSLSPPTVAAL